MIPSVSGMPELVDTWQTYASSGVTLTPPGIVMRLDKTIRLWNRTCSVTEHTPVVGPSVDGIQHNTRKWE